MLAALALVITCNPIQASDLGRWISTHDDLGGVTAVAPRPDGGVMAIDGDTGTLHRISAQGVRTRLDLSPHLREPRGLTATVDGFLIADAGRDCIVAFDSAGALRETLGQAGRSPGQFLLPSDVAYRDGLIVVADTGNDRVQILSPATGQWRTIGARGTADGLFKGPTAVAVDGDGGVWVADTHNHRVQHFDAQGAHVRSIGSWGAYPGQFIEPTGIDVRDGRVIVADRLNHRVQVLDAATGAPIDSWGMHAVYPRQGQGRVHYPADVSLLTGGSVAVAEPFEERLQIFGPGGVAVEQRGRPAPRGVQSHFGPVADTDGRFFVTWEPELRAIHLFDLHRPTPLRLSTFGRPGAAPGELGHITALLVDADRSRLLALDAGNHRLHEWRLDAPPPDEPRFDPNMARLLRSIPLEQGGEGDLAWQGTEVVHMRRATGDALNLDEEDDVPSPDPAIVDPIACDDVVEPDGHVRVAILDAAGPAVHLYGWPTLPRIDLDDLVDPRDVAIAGDGSIIVVDRGAHRVVRYGADGRPMNSWGSRGIEHESFWRPAAVVVDDRDRVIVLDHGNHRAQMFDLDGTWLMTFGAGRAWTPESLPRKTTEDESVE